MVGAMRKALVQKRRFDIENLRVEEWVNFVVTGTVGVTRVAFLLGFGVGNGGPSCKEKGK
jgi:hypothetical protein